MKGFGVSSECLAIVDQVHRIVLPGVVNVNPIGLRQPGELCNGSRQGWIDGRKRLMMGAR